MAVDNGFGEPASRAWVLIMLASTIGVMVLASWTLVNTWYQNIDDDVKSLRMEQRLLRQELREDNRRLEDYLLELMRQNRKEDKK